MKSDNDTNYFHLAFAYYNLTMQNASLCFNLIEPLDEPPELGYTHIVTITVIQVLVYNYYYSGVAYYLVVGF